MEARLESLQSTFRLLVNAINNGRDTEPATEQFMTTVKWLEQWMTSQALTSEITAPTITRNQLDNEMTSIKQDIALKDQLLSQADEALARWETWLASTTPSTTTTTTDITS